MSSISGQIEWSYSTNLLCEIEIELAGACRYESLALDISGGHLAAGVAFLFKDGAGCGACFHVCIQLSGGTRPTIVYFINYYIIVMTN